MQNEIHKNADITASSEQTAKLKAMFPSCFDAEGRFRPDKLEEILRADGADITREGYKLDWLGKSYARLLANLKTETLLAPNVEHNKKPENADSQNLLIQGDNLDVLKHLVNAYSEKVKMIYIDPPYNTGSDGFVYSDDRTFTSNELAKLAGIDEDEAKRVLTFAQSKSNTHSAWLTFMYPRLYVARELLKDTGAIFISIDDNEQAQLKLLCDEVFGEENFVSQFVWAAGRKNDSKLVSTSHEYVFCYARDKVRLLDKDKAWEERKKGLDQIYKQFEIIKASCDEGDFSEMTKMLRSWYAGLDETNPAKRHRHYKSVDKNGIYFPADISWIGGGGPQYVVLHPETTKPVKNPKRGWMTPDEEKMKSWIEQELVHFGDDETTVPCIKAYLSNNEFAAPYSLFYQDGRAATKRLRTLVGEKVFPYPKDEIVLGDFVDFCTKEGDLVLDFFAGSGSTGHSIMKRNAETGISRNYILVQLDESTKEDSDARKAGYETIFDITRKRILSAAKKVQNDNPEATCDFGFKEFKTIPANDGPFAHYLDDADVMEDYVPFDGMALDQGALGALLTTWKVYDGLPLHQDLVQIDLGGYIAHLGDHILYFVNKGLELTHITEMLRRIDEEDDFAPRKLVVFHHVLGDKILREFSEAVNAPNRKHLELTFEQRF